MLQLPSILLIKLEIFSLLAKKMKSVFYGYMQHSKHITSPFTVACFGFGGKAFPTIINGCVCLLINWYGTIPSEASLYHSKVHSMQNKHSNNSHFNERKRSEI